MVHPAQHPLTRRTALSTLSWGIAGVAVAGCSVNTPGAEAGSSGRTRSSTTRAAELDNDQQIVLAMVAELTSSLDLVTGVGTAHPGLKQRLAGLVSLERAHLGVLQQAAKDLPGTPPLPTSSPSSVPAGRAAGLTAVRERTRALHTTCLSSAARAESGPFARLLASMGCALAQRMPALQSSGSTP